MTNYDDSIADRRLQDWGWSYLASTEESFQRAGRARESGDTFTAYLYLFVTFNNLYALLTRFEGHEGEKIRAAVARLTESDVDRIYTSEYVSLISDLNDRQTEQFSQGPESRSDLRGIINMKHYFLGQSPEECVVHLDEVANAGASLQDRRRTLEDVAATLLFTVRNNHFHAVKGAERLADQLTLDAAYWTLLPIVQALLPIANKSI